MRVGSVAYQVRMRADAQPVCRPASRDEFANAASRTGPSACRADSRAATRCGSPASRQTCRPAVLHIMVAPCGPARSKAACIAA